MKIKLLTTIIAGVLLAGCGGGNDNSVDGGGDKDKKTTPVLAFDGAINGMVASYTCADGTSGTTTTKTDGYGLVTVLSDTFADKPESCSVVLSVPTDGEAFDMSNRKNMQKVVYTIPKGLLKVGQDVAATPFTTLIEKTMAETKDDIITATNSVFSSLGFGSSLTEDQKLGLLTTPAATLETLSPGLKKSVAATTVVLSDVLVSQKENKTVTVAEMAAVTETIAADIIVKNPDYPKSNGETIVIDVSGVLADEETFNEAVNGDVPKAVSDIITNPPTIPDADIPDPENPPVDPTPEPTPPPTGGTGGSGDGGGNGN